MKRVLVCFGLLSFFLSGSSCKKVTLYSFDLSGLWLGTAETSCVCDYTYIDIPKDAKNGIYAGKTNEVGCDKKWKGTVRYNHNHLYIGNTKFKFIRKPVLVEGDSIKYWTQIPGKITAEMTLETSLLHDRNIYKFIRVKEY